MSESVMSESLQVALGERSYEIIIGAGILAQLARWLPPLKGKQLMLVSNQTVAPLYLEQLRAAFALSDTPFSLDSVELPDGEQFKTLEVLNHIFTALLKNTHSRTTTLVALGGGVVGDMVGFAAASYQRGVDFIQVPTTLLSQVDSSVGGKTGVNHAQGKNMIGAFHQPRLVLIDTNTLSTLPDAELASGLAEVIKYGLIYDADFFAWLEQNMAALLQRQPQSLITAIKRCCQIKAEIVAQDEREGGIRAILNLGHTFGHAIETASGYGNWLHGEAVAVGMLMAIDLSYRLGNIKETILERTRSLLRAANLPVNPPAQMTAQQFLDLMAVDKKNIDKRLRLVLLKTLGNAYVTDQVPEALLRQLLEDHLTS